MKKIRKADISIPLESAYDAYVNRMGCYPTRTDRDEMEFNKFSYADINVLPVDIEFVNYNYMDVQDFYTFYSEEFN